MSIWNPYNTCSSISFEVMNRKSLITVFILLAVSVFTNAQVKVGATPTGKHAKAVHRASDVKEQIKQRKDQAKKIGAYAKAKDKYKKKYEKLKKKKEKKWEKDSIQNPKVGKSKWVWNRQDSLALSEEIMERTDFPSEYQELIRNPPSLPKKDSIGLQKPVLDSALVTKGEDKIANELEKKAKDHMPEEMAESAENSLAHLTNNPIEGQEQLERLPDVKKPSKPNPNLIKPDAAKDLFKKIDPEQFQKVQADMTKLKKKYSSLPDTRFPEEGKKRNSLAELPFKKRLYFGGNINLSSTDPLIVDVNLQVGYWINKKWMGGVGLILREQFNNQDSTSLTGDAHGYSLFIRYDLPKSFYAWGEMQRQLNRSLINTNETNFPASWEEAYLLGIGRDFKIGPVGMSTMVMYDFNYQKNDLNNRPLVFRLGFQLSKRPK